MKAPAHGTGRARADTSAKGATVSAISYYTRLPSPLGPLLLVGTDDALTQVWLPSGRDRRDPDADWVEAPRRSPSRSASSTPTSPGGCGGSTSGSRPSGTPFQQTVWRALSDIPYGETVSYGELARRIGRPAAVRAVGAANGQNPLAIVVPCHRVIGSDGRLVGYGGGLPAKVALLELERRAEGAPARPVRPRQGALFV